MMNLMEFEWNTMEFDRDTIGFFMEHLAESHWNHEPMKLWTRLLCTRFFFFLWSRTLTGS